MQRFTISLDEELAQAFDHTIAQHGYINRSEAVRDLIRARLDSEVIATEAAPWSAATVSYVYDHHDHTVTSRLLALQHADHDLVVSSLHTHLDHANCLETVVLRGPSAAVRSCADRLTALRGVRHGSAQVIPLAMAHEHQHPHAAAPHTHLKPLS